MYESVAKSIGASARYDLYSLDWVRIEVLADQGTDGVYSD